MKLLKIDSTWDKAPLSWRHATFKFHQELNARLWDQRAYFGAIEQRQFERAMAQIGTLQTVKPCVGVTVKIEGEIGASNVSSWRQEIIEEEIKKDAS